MQTLVEYLHDRPNRKAQLRSTRMDKLLLHRGHERQNGKDRRTSSYGVAQSDMETMETYTEAGMGLRKLGVDNELANLTSNCGDRYEWVVRKTCVARAISK